MFRIVIGYAAAMSSRKDRGRENASLTQVNQNESRKAVKLRLPRCTTNSPMPL